MEVTGVKKHRTETAKEDWHIVKNNKKRDRAAKSPKSLKPWDVKQPKVKKKPDAVIINPEEGHTYAEILKNLRNKVTTDVKIKTARKTRNGALF